MPSFAELLVPEFDREALLTEQVLASVPDASLAWKPHDRAMSLGRLATHVAGLPRWIGAFFASTELEVSDLPRLYDAEVTSAVELVTRFSARAAAARAVLASKTDPEYEARWSLCEDGRPLFTLPRVAVVRFACANHLVHHRGQLTIYLRLLDVPLPTLYGTAA
jgi:uncharacterized damage-inducible protein DinB